MLLVLLIIACGGVPIIENPNTTLLHFHPRFQDLVKMLKARGISRLAARVDVFCE